MGVLLVSQAPIADICKRMGHGMADFIEKEVISIADFDLYCHYVAGLVGVGLGQLFSASKLEKMNFNNFETLANDMGLFLQKTNIIRDYLEDIEEEPAPRMFWPRDVWNLYATELADFKEPENRQEALKCLNHMIADALRHVPQCLEYMSNLEDPMIFRFCAIPQVVCSSWDCLTCLEHQTWLRSSLIYPQNCFMLKLPFVLAPRA